MPTAPTASIKPRRVDVYQGQPGETVRLVELPRRAIFIPEYQRDRKAHHKKIAGEFDRTAYAFPIVIEFEGAFGVIDGQQRLAACELCGMEDVIVLLIQGVKSQQRAASLYLKYNRDRKGLDAFEKFIGAHAAKDPGTLEITRVLTDDGLHAARSASAPDSVPAGAVTAIHNLYGAATLARVLEIRELAWGDANERESRESKTLRGLAAFLNSYWESVDDVALIDTLRKLHPASLLSKTDGNQHGSFESRYSDYLRDLYNKKFPRGKKRL